jgi:periplasmic divalent cation tolerance protein
MSQIDPSSDPSTPYGMILTTAGSREEAEAIAKLLLEECLAACVNYFAIESLYRWRGAVQKDMEWQLIIKTNLALKPTIEARLLAMHSYELPEFIVIPFQGGSEAYFHWLGNQLQA